MKEYIDKEALNKLIDREIDICNSGMIRGELEFLKAIVPIAADVVERKRGEWEDEYGGAFANPRYRCSVCKEKALYRHEQDCLGGWHEVQALTDFCPHCNADLRSHHDSLCDQTEEVEHEP